MGYLSEFKYDVFISYAHMDNLAIDNKEDGWVTKFFKHFQFQLNRYLEGSNTAEIWFDHDLRKNEAFDARIKNGIEDSAILLALTSNRYYTSGYCKQEREFFHTNAPSRGFGLVVNDKRRIFNVQQLNKPYQEWPLEFQGGLAYNMFKNSNPSTSRVDDPGITLDSKLDEDAYSKMLLEIVRDVSETLKAMKKTPAPPPQKAKVFFANVEEKKLKELKAQIITELKANSIIVDEEDIPPPFIKTEHEEAVTKKLNDLELSIHLFNDIPGHKMAGDYPFSYSQEQFFISEKLKKDQLIFIPQELNFSTLPDESYKNFLSELLTNKPADSKYNLIREFSVPQIIDHIKEKIITLSTVAPDYEAILLDYNNTDIVNAVNYFNDLQNTRKNLKLAPPGNGPSEAIEKYGQLLNEVTHIIIVCFTVAKEWLNERLKQIASSIRTGRSRVNKLQLYSEKGIEDVNLDQLMRFFF